MQLKSFLTRFGSVRFGSVWFGSVQAIKNFYRFRFGSVFKVLVSVRFNFSKTRTDPITGSDKIKKRQMPSRAMVNKLQVSEIPYELKNLNNLEKHLIALRLPFMKIVNLSSGKISNKRTSGIKACFRPKKLRPKTHIFGISIKF